MPALCPFAPTVSTSKWNGQCFGLWSQDFSSPLYLTSRQVPIPVAARPKALVCGRLLVGIAGSNPAEYTDVCFSSSRGVLTSDVCVSVCARGVRVCARGVRVCVRVRVCACVRGCVCPWVWSSAVVTLYTCIEQVEIGQNKKESFLCHKKVTVCVDSIVRYTSSILAKCTNCGNTITVIGQTLGKCTRVRSFAR